jgi:hypothetical protein
MMNQEDLFKKLGLILNELNEQYQFLAENPQQLSELELELFQANANFLADHVQIIKKINNNQALPFNLAKPDERTESHVQNTSIDEGLQDEDQVEEITFADQTEEALQVDPTAVLEEEPELKADVIEEEVFKLDPSPSTFEFILNDHAEHEPIDGTPQTGFNQYAQDSPKGISSELITNENKLKGDEKFEFEEKSVDELFNRPLSEEEEQVLEQKRKLREQPLADLVETEAEEDEIGPEPFLVKTAEEFPIKKEDLTLEAAPQADIEVNFIEPVEDPTYKPTLNDLLAKSTSKNINSNAGTGVTDLKQAINLNDKLLYIKDLFNGYNLAYSEAIELANKLPNFEAADSFFKKNYADKNNWASKQATVDKFYALLNQRFK